MGVLSRRPWRKAVFGACTSFWLAAAPVHAQPAPASAGRDQPVPAQPVLIQPGAAANAPSRSAAIADLFQHFCLDTQPSLVRLERQAGALHGSKQSDKIVPTGPGRSLHQETWLVRRDTGIYQLTAMEGDAAAGPFRAAGCGLTAGEADGVELAQALAMSGLGAPARRVLPEGGPGGPGGQGGSVVWTKRFGANTGRVLLSYGGALTGGASLHLILPKLPPAALAPHP